MEERPFYVLLVGAGEVNFGSVEGPWNHSLRLERCLGPRLRITGIVDPDTSRAEQRRASRLATEHASSWYDCKIFSSIQDAASFSSTTGTKPNLTILGTPPWTRGDHVPNRDGELQCARLFPSSTLLVEKPLSSQAPLGVRNVLQALNNQHIGPVGVGYMLRYLKAVQKMKEIVRDNNLVVMGTHARYIMQYPDAIKPAWWNKLTSGGPIVEQATHLADLSLFLGGSVDLTTINVHTVEHDDPPGHLTQLGIDEEVVPPGNRLPRLTNAQWRYQSGAVGSLTHAIALHGGTYETTLEVIADGALLRLEDPYGVPTLHVRLGKNPTQTIKYPEDDPYQSQMDAYVAAAEHSDQAGRILCTYEEAVRTYEFTWSIKTVSDETAERRRDQKQGTAQG